MNALENWFCSTWFWRYATRRQVLPWVFGGSDLGDHVLELGAGPGAGTDELRRLSPRVTSVEYSHAYAAALAARTLHEDGSNRGGKGTSLALQGDAAVLPFASCTFSSVVAILVLHHLRASELQDRAFAEIYRVLKPNGCFYAFEIQNGWFNRVIHTNSTFTPVQPASAPARLTSAGFSRVTVDIRRGGFRIRARRAAEP